MHFYEFSSSTSTRMYRQLPSVGIRITMHECVYMYMCANRSIFVDKAAAGRRDLGSNEAIERH